MKPHIEFTAVVIVGLLGSVAITELAEKWIANGTASDWVAADIEDCGIGDWCECLDGWKDWHGEIRITGKAICDDDHIDQYVEISIEPIKSH